jgi:selenocysteine lyase/cysteine desulfurase
MLTAVDFDALRRREFARLDEAGEIYLDYTGSAIPAASLVAAHHQQIDRAILGNPHSAHAASRRSTAMIADARAAVLEFFGVGASTHAVCFTANASAAIKLVAESYPFGPSRGLVLAADNHNSVNGLREFARGKNAPLRYLPPDDDLRLADPLEHLRASARGGGLFAFPAQSNFSGVEHPLTLVNGARALGFDVLLDAAAFVPTHSLDLAACDADFVVVSFYKMFGYPTGVGALVARRDALARLSRPWFAGGTVDVVSVQNDRHALRGGGEAFEDGTPNFASIGAVPAGLDLLRGIGMRAIDTRVRALTAKFLGALQELSHPNGAPLVTIYGPRDASRRGGTVAFNVLDSSGRVQPYEPIEIDLSDRKIFVRGGCFCNPGAAEAAFHFDAETEARCLSSLEGRFTVSRLAECLGSNVAVGALRASIGVPTTETDLNRAIGALREITRCPR